MADRYPGYDVLDKRQTPSWNQQTRAVIDRRLSLPRGPRFFSETQFATLSAIAERIVPQPSSRAPIPVAALVDEKLVRDQQDGFRGEGMPRQREAWQRGLDAMEAEAQAVHGTSFTTLDGAQQDALLKRAEAGEADHPAWGGMPAKTFFKQRLITDIVHAYYAHPTAWNEIGWGGPASPRGYVRMGYDERDPWEAAEGESEAVRRRNQRAG